MTKVLIHHPVLGPISVDKATMWDADVVFERMVEAFRTLARLPARIYPSAGGNGMPSYLYEWSDFLAQAETAALEAGREPDQHQLKQIAAALRDTWDERNLRRIPPTAAEIARMNESLAWPMIYLGDEPMLAEFVNQFAAHAARPENDHTDTFSEWCFRQGRISEVCRRAARSAMGLIAVELNKAGADI